MIFIANACIKNRIENKNKIVLLFHLSFEDDESKDNEQHEVAMEKKKESDRGKCRIQFVQTFFFE